MLPRLPIALAQVKAGNKYIKCYIMKFNSLLIFCIEQNELLKKQMITQSFQYR